MRRAGAQCDYAHGQRIALVALEPSEAKLEQPVPSRAVQREEGHLLRGRGRGRGRV